MLRLLHRAAALLLIPILLADPSRVHAMTTLDVHWVAPGVTGFEQQAIVARLVAAFERPGDRVAAWLARLMEPLEFSFSAWTGSGFDFPVPREKTTFRIPGVHLAIRLTENAPVSGSGTTAVPPVRRSRQIDSALEVLESSKASRDARRRAAKSLFKNREEMIPGDAVRMAAAMERRGLKDEKTLGWILMALNQRAWHGLTEEERTAYIGHIESYVRGRKQFPPGQQLALLRPIFTAVSAEENEQKIPGNIRRFWTHARRPGIGPQKLMILRRAVRDLQPSRDRPLVPEKEIRRMFGLERKRFDKLMPTFLAYHGISPFQVSILGRYKAQEWIEAALPILWSEPGSTIDLAEISALLRLPPRGLFHWVTQRCILNPLVFLRETFHVVVPSTDSKAITAGGPLIKGGVWMYFREHGLGGRLDLQESPSPLEKRLVRGLILRVARAAARGRVKTLHYNALLNTPISVGTYQFVLEPLVDRIGEMYPDVTNRVMLMLQRYGFMKSTLKPLEEITEVKDFRRLYATGTLQSVPWPKVTLKLKQALVRELAGQQYGKDLLWLDSEDYREPLRSIVDAKNRPLTLTGLYANLAEQQRRDKIKQYSPFYILEALKLVDGPIPYIHPLKSLTTKVELVTALRKRWLRYIAWDFVSAEIQREIILEFAFRLNKPIRELTQDDYNKPLKSLGLRVWKPAKRRFEDVSLTTINQKASWDPGRTRGITASQHVAHTLWPNGEPQWITLQDLAKEAGIEEKTLNSKIKRGIVIPFAPAGCENLQPVRIERGEENRVVSIAWKLRREDNVISQTVARGWDIPRLVQAVDAAQDAAAREELFNEVLWAAEGRAARRFQNALNRYFTTPPEDSLTPGQFQRQLETLLPLIDRFPPGFGKLQGNPDVVNALEYDMTRRFAVRLQQLYPRANGMTEDRRIVRLEAMSEFLSKIILRDKSLVPPDLFSRGVLPNHFVPGALVMAPKDGEPTLGLITTVQGNGSNGAINGHVRQATLRFSSGDNVSFGVSALTLVIPATQLYEAYALLDKISAKPGSKKRNLTALASAAAVVLAILAGWAQMHAPGHPAEVAANLMSTVSLPAGRFWIFHFFAAPIIAFFTSRSFRQSLFSARRLETCRIRTENLLR